ncbi:MAG: CPBP family intramembrane metalloprotease [Bacteroidales bacterium]|nr:CPBP family intramembrane metalloprotease [Bacteroidales bacterium]
MKKALIFSLAVCLVSWAIYYGIVTLAGESFTGNPIIMTLFKSVYMFFPLLTALALQIINKEKITDTGFLRIKFSWAWVWAIIAVIAAIVICIPVSALMPGVEIHFGADQVISMNGLSGEQADLLRSQLEMIPPTAILASTLISGVLAGCTINAVAAFGEEYGWRNYMVACLKGKKFIIAALFIGLVWGIWHTPLILEGHNYPQHPVIGVAMMCIFCILAGVIELYFVLKTQSVVIAAVIHGCINAMAGAVVLCIVGGNDLTVGLTGVAGFISLSLVCLAIFVYDKRIAGDNIMTSPIR